MKRVVIGTATVLVLAGCSNSAAPAADSSARTAQGTQAPPDEGYHLVTPQVTFDGEVLPANPVQCYQLNHWYIRTPDHVEESSEKVELIVWADNHYADGSPVMLNDNRSPEEVPVESVSIRGAGVSAEWNSDPEVDAARGVGWAQVATARDGDVFTFAGEVNEGRGSFTVRVECDGWRAPE